MPTSGSLMKVKLPSKVFAWKYSCGNTSAACTLQWIPNGDMEPRTSRISALFTAWPVWIGCTYCMFQWLIKKSCWAGIILKSIRSWSTEINETDCRSGYCTTQKLVYRENSSASLPQQWDMCSILRFQLRCHFIPERSGASCPYQARWQNFKFNIRQTDYALLVLSTKSK